MSDVKRYEAVHLRYDDNNIRYGEGCEVEVVLASDYAALEAELREECERLREAQKNYFSVTIQHGAAVAEAQAQSDKLAGLLRESRLKIAYMLKHGEWHSPEELIDRIDAALAEVKP